MGPSPVVPTHSHLVDVGMEEAVHKADGRTLERVLRRQAHVHLPRPPFIRSCRIIAKIGHDMAGSELPLLSVLPCQSRQLLALRRPTYSLIGDDAMKIILYLLSAGPWKSTEKVWRQDSSGRCTLKSLIMLQPHTTPRHTAHPHVSLIHWNPPQIPHLCTKQI